MYHLFLAVIQKEPSADGYSLWETNKCVHIHSFATFHLGWCSAVDITIQSQPIVIQSQSIDGHYFVFDLHSHAYFLLNFNRTDMCVHKNIQLSCFRELLRFQSVLCICIIRWWNVFCDHLSFHLQTITSTMQHYNTVCPCQICTVAVYYLVHVCVDCLMENVGNLELSGWIDLHCQKDHLLWYI